MRTSYRSEALARALLTLGALLPYWALLSFDMVLVADDGFTSDIWNGELPGRLEMARLLAHGELPTWTSRLCSGIPLSPVDPISLGLFVWLPLPAALDAFLLFLVMVAAHGCYSLARRFDVTRPGAVLAGMAFSASGYMVSQLRHLGIVSTVAWMPLALALLDQALASTEPACNDAPARRSSPANRGLYFSAFGLVYGMQVLCGFPQSAYICGLVYGAYSVFRVWTDKPLEPVTPVRRFLPLTAAGLVAVLGAAVGAVVLLPLSELGSFSDRSGGNTFEWASFPRYWPPNFLTFIFPYLFGDWSDATYHGPSLFWEDYGYVGVATFFLAIYGGIVDRKRGVTRFLLGMTLLTYVLVLGPSTPLFRIAFEVVPGLKLFRCPTRFLIVVDLGLALLAAIGLSRIEAPLRERLRRLGAERALPLVIAGVCVGTALDLLIHQPRQNPMVFSEEWLEPPFTARMIQDERGRPGDKRIFAPFRMEFHIAANAMARGAADLRAYYLMRDLVEPNSNLYWDLPSADCYAGISPRWHIDVWGDHNRGPLLMYQTVRPMRLEQRLDASPAFGKLLGTYGVTHVITAFPAKALGEPMPTPPAGEKHGVLVYRVPGAARVRMVENAVVVTSSQEAVHRLLERTFDPNQTVFLHDAPKSVETRSAPATAGGKPRVRIESERAAEVVVRAHTPNAGFLLLADTFYPGWSAEVDGKPAPLYRANISVRAVPVPSGDHVVRFSYQPKAFFRGLTISAISIALLLVGLFVSLGLRWRERRAA